MGKAEIYFILFPVFTFILVVFSLYFIIKLAVKNAIKELKDKNVL